MDMTRILIAESLDFDTLKDVVNEKNAILYNQIEVPADALESQINLSYQPDLTPAEIEKKLKNYDGLIIRPKQVTAKVINSAKNLKIIVRGGAGMNSIDLKAAKAKNVVVENTPGENSISTAEFTFAMILELVARRHVYISDSDARAGKATAVEDYQGEELFGKKLAIVGLGSIGLELAKRAEAFGMTVTYFSRNKKEVEYIRYDSLKNLLESKPDIISLHVPLTDETRDMFGMDEFKLMGQGTVLINCARPQLISPQALGWAMQEGIVKSAGIDGDMELIEPFIQIDAGRKCLFTHHIADSTKQAQQKITRQVLTQILAYFREGKIINGCV